MVSTPTGYGAAYVFDFDGSAWAQTTRLVDDVGGGNGVNRFGASVALDGGRAVIGARRDQSSGGQAFVYRYNGGTWSQATALQWPRPAVGQEFRASSAIEGRRFIIGAPYPTLNAPEFGAVYVYRDQTAVEGEASPLAARPRLLSPRPNPASGTSRPLLTLSQPEHVTATVFDALGRAVQTVLGGDLVAGELTLTVDAGRLAPGLYVVRVAGETFTESTRLVVAR